MIVVTEQAKDFFCGVQHPEDKVVRLDLAENNALNGRSGEKQVRMAAGEPRPGGAPHLAGRERRV